MKILKVHISAITGNCQPDDVLKGWPLCGAPSGFEPTSGPGRVRRTRVTRRTSFVNLPAAVQCRSCASMSGITESATEETVLSIEAALIGIARVFA